MFSFFKKKPPPLTAAPSAVRDVAQPQAAAPAALDKPASAPQRQTWLGKLKAGELDAVVATRSEIESVLRGDTNFELIDAPFDRLPRQGWVNGLAVIKENTELAKLLQAAVNELFESGEMSAIFAKHGVKSIKP